MYPRIRETEGVEEHHGVRFDKGTDVQNVDLTIDKFSSNDFTSESLPELHFYEQAQ
jgi:hypothetical protein